MDLTTVFERVENTLVARLRKTRAGIKHHGDRGENIEVILRDFLSSNLSARFGVTKGEIMSRTGEHSYAADIIVYDAVSCPVLYWGTPKCSQLRASTE